MDNGELVFVKKRFEWRKARVQAKKSVKVDRRVSRAPTGSGDRNRRTQPVVIWLAERHDDIQTICSAALEQHDKLPFVRHGRRGNSALQEGRHRAQAHHGHAALLQEIAPRKFQVSYAFATFVAHRLFITFSEIPAHPAPAPQPRRDPLVFVDHRAWPAAPAGFPTVSGASRLSSALRARRGKPARRGRAPLSHPLTIPCPAAKPHPCECRASCFPQEPGNNSSGSAARRYSPTLRPCPRNRSAAGIDKAARRFAQSTAPTAAACPRPSRWRAPWTPQVRTAS